MQAISQGGLNDQPSSPSISDDEELVRSLIEPLVINNQTLAVSELRNECPTAAETSKEEEEALFTEEDSAPASLHCLSCGSAVEDRQVASLLQQLATKDMSLDNEIRLSRRLSQELDECRLQLKRKDCLLGERLIDHENLLRTNERLAKALQQITAELAETQRLLDEQTRQNKELLGQRRTSNMADCCSGGGDDYHSNIKTQRGRESLTALLNHARDARQQLVELLESRQLTSNSWQEAELNDSMVSNLTKELGELMSLLNLVEEPTDNPFNERYQQKYLPLLEVNSFDGNVQQMGKTAKVTQERHAIRRLKKKNSLLMAELLDMR